MNVSCQACGRAFTVETRAVEAPSFVARCPACGAPVIVRPQVEQPGAYGAHEDLPAPKGWEPPPPARVAEALHDLPVPVAPRSEPHQGRPGDTMQSSVEDVQAILSMAPTAPAAPVSPSLLAGTAPPASGAVSRTAVTMADLPVPKRPSGDGGTPPGPLDTFANLPAPKRAGSTADEARPLDTFANLPAPKREAAGAGGAALDLTAHVPGLDELNDELRDPRPPPAEGEEIVDLPMPRDHKPPLLPTVAPAGRAAGPVSVPELPLPVPRPRTGPGAAAFAREPRPGDELRPVGGDELRPVGRGDELRPAGPGGELRPVGPGGELRPVGPGGELRPVGPGGELRPVGPGGEVRPVDGGHEIRPSEGAHEVRPVGPGGELRPVAPGHGDELRPVGPGQGSDLGLLDLQWHDDLTPLPRSVPALDASGGPYGERPAGPSAWPVAGAAGQAGAGVADGLEGALEGAAPDGTAGAPVIIKVVEKERAPMSRRARLALVASGVAILVAGMGLGGYLLVNTDLGEKVFGFDKSARALRREKLAAAHGLLADDTVGSYRKAAASFEDVAELDKQPLPGRPLAAQARLAIALLGVTAEIRQADRLLKDLAGGEADIEVKKARALRALVDGKVAEAEAQLGALVQADKAGKDATALVYLGWTHLYADNAAAARKDFEQALKIDPRRAQALYGLGRAQEAAGDTKAALESYGKTMAESPQHFGAALGSERLGEATSASEQRVQILLQSHAANAAPRELAEAWSLLGRRSAEGGRLDEAEARYVKATATFPSLIDPRIGLARTLSALKRAPEAVPVAEAAVKSQPGNPQALLALVQAQLESGVRAMTVQPNLTAAEKSGAPKAAVSYWWGRLEEAKGPDGSIDRAIERYREALKADLHFVVAYMALAQALVKVGRGDEAHDVLEEARKQAFDPAAKDELGEAYLAAGQLAQAEKLFTEVVKEAPGLLSARFHLGETQEREGRLDKAAETYADIGVLQKDAPGLAERRGRVTLALGNVDEALAFLQAAVAAEKAPLPTLLATTGEALLRAGRPAEAKPLFEQAVRANDRLGAGHLGLARSLLAEGKLTEAENEGRRAVNQLGSPAAHLALAQVYEAQRNFDRAGKEYEAAAKRAPGPAGPGDEALAMEARIGGVRILVRIGQVKSALDQARKLQREAPRRSEPAVLIGDCLTGQGQLDAALTAYEEATRLGAKNPEAFFKYAQALADGGKYYPAAKAIDEAIKIGVDRTGFAADAYLLAGDTHKQINEPAPAAAAYRKYLAVADPGAKARRTVELWLASPGAPSAPAPGPGR